MLTGHIDVGLDDWLLNFGDCFFRLLLLLCFFSLCFFLLLLLSRLGQIVFFGLNKAANGSEAIDRLGYEYSMQLLVFQLEVLVLLLLFVLQVSLLQTVTDGVEAHLLIVWVIHLRVFQLISDFLRRCLCWLSGQLDDLCDVADELGFAFAKQRDEAAAEAVVADQD